MNSLKTLLTIGGLVVITGPFCFSALAQGDFVDLEAEAAAREAAGQMPANDQAEPVDPYAAKPAQSYPVTGYGVTPVQPASTTGAYGAVASGAAAPGAVAPGAAAPGPAAGSNALANLVLQVQQLQRDVMRLNGKVEEQAHELRTLKEQNLQRYMDLDKRLSSGVAANTAAQAPTKAIAAPVAAPGPSASSGGDGVAQPGEKAAYDAAYGLVVGRQFSQAIPAFQQFLQDFPAGKFAPNAHYWLGELYLVSEPPDLESARQSFALLISEYPNHAKVPDSLYKLGKVQFMKGNREKAREYLDLVVAQYGSSNSSVVKLAEDFIADNY